MIRLALLLSLGLHAQNTVQLGSASDPCTGGATWQYPPMRYGSGFSCVIPFSGADALHAPGYVYIDLKFQQPKSSPTQIINPSPDWVFTVGGSSLLSQAPVDINAGTGGGTADLILASVLTQLQSDYAVHLSLSSTCPACSRNAVLSAVTVRPFTPWVPGWVSSSIAPMPGQCPTNPFGLLRLDTAGYLYACLPPGLWFRFGPGASTW